MCTERVHVVWSGSADGIWRNRGDFVTAAVLRGNQGNGVHDRILDAAQKCVVCAFWRQFVLNMCSPIPALLLAGKSWDSLLFAG